MCSTENVPAGACSRARRARTGGRPATASCTSSGSSKYCSCLDAVDRRLRVLVVAVVRPERLHLVEPQRVVDERRGRGACSCRLTATSHVQRVEARAERAHVEVEVAAAAWCRSRSAAAPRVVLPHGGRAPRCRRGRSARGHVDGTGAVRARAAPTCTARFGPSPGPGPEPAAARRPTSATSTSTEIRFTVEASPACPEGPDCRTVRPVRATVARHRDARVARRSRRAGDRRRARWSGRHASAR